MRGIWFSPRAIALHVVIVVIVPTFAALCDWQVHRALSGNELSWAYVFEWPFFAGYAIYVWWRFIHEPPAALSAAPAAGVRAAAASPTASASTQSASATTSSDDGDASRPIEPTPLPADEELAAYNRYLAELDAGGDTKHW